MTLVIENFKMLGCCHCLCSKEYSAYTRVESCYPNDGRADPVYARVRELINWGTHDVDRFSTIHEILADRIQQDILRGNDAGVQVGLKICANILQNVREINHNLSTTMAQCITQLVETKREPLLQIATSSTHDLIQYTQRHMLSTPVTRIINSFLNLVTDENLKETVFSSVTEIISKSSIEWIPIANILKVIKTYFSENSARNIAKAIAKIVVPLILVRLTTELFQFFTQNNLWNDEDFLSSIMILFFNEMPDNCAPGFFKCWLEQLPPRSPEAGHCKTLISITVRLVEQISPEKLISQAQTDSLDVLYLFVLNLPQLMYNDKASILDNALVIERFIVSHIPQPELLKIAHRQIWMYLPEAVNHQLDYEHEKVGLIFRFAAAFNESAKGNLTKSMIQESLLKISKFLLSFHHDETILKIVLDHIHDLYVAYPPARIDSVVYFLLDLQKDVIEHNNDITLHTFIMYAMHQAVRDGPPGLTEYVQSVCNARIEAQPPQVDLHLSFIVDQFPALQGVKPGASATVTEYFKKQNVKSNVSQRRQSSAVAVAIAHATFAQMNNNQQDEEEEPDEVFNAPIPHLVFTEDGEASEQSIAEPVPATFEDAMKKQKANAKEHDDFVKSIKDMTFEWKSHVPLPEGYKKIEVPTVQPSPKKQKTVQFSILAEKHDESESGYESEYYSGSYYYYSDDGK